MRAVLAAVRARHSYQVFEARDFQCVALVREVPEAPLPAGDADEEERGGHLSGGGGGGGGGRGEAAAGEAPQVDEARLLEAAEAGSLQALLDLGLPRPFAGVHA